MYESPRLGSKQVIPEGCHVNFEMDQPMHQLRLTRVLAVLMKESLGPHRLR